MYKIHFSFYIIWNIKLWLGNHPYITSAKTGIREWGMGVKERSVVADIVGGLVGSWAFGSDNVLTYVIYGWPLMHCLFFL